MIHLITGVAIFSASLINGLVSRFFAVMGSAILAFFMFHFGSLPISISWWP